MRLGPPPGLPVSFAIAPLLLASCGGAAAPIARVPQLTEADDQQSTCKVAKDPLNPLIVEWPGTSKVDLDGTSQRGAVIVSYVGCGPLKVLTSCQASGMYEYIGVTPITEKISLQSESDLFARLPLGVATLKGELAMSSRLELQYVAVGRRTLTRPPPALTGDCRGATHYVRTLTLGAYALDAVGTARAGAKAEIADRGVGGERRDGVRRVHGQGNVALCGAGFATEDAAKGATCAGILQIGLAPLTASGGGVVLSAGFGDGLGPLAVVPTVRDFGASAPTATSLAETDVQLLERLQYATRSEQSAVTSPAQRAEAWSIVASMPGNNPFRQQAAARSEEWRTVVRAEERHREQLARVCEQHGRDEAKLARVLQLDDAIVSPRQKRAYSDEMAQVYAPWRSELRTCVDPDTQAFQPPRAVAPSSRGRAAASRRAAGYWVGGIGLVGAGAGIAMGLVARSQYRGASNSTGCAGDVCKSKAEADAATQQAQADYDTKQSALRLGNAGTIAGIVGGVGAAVGLTLLMSGLGGEDPPRQTSTVRAFSAIDGQGFQVGLRGALW